MSKTEGKLILKIALYGAVMAVLITHFIDPSIKKAMGVSK